MQIQSVTAEYLKTTLLSRKAQNFNIFYLKKKVWRVKSRTWLHWTPTNKRIKTFQGVKSIPTVSKHSFPAHMKIRQNLWADGKYSPCTHPVLFSSDTTKKKKGKVPDWKIGRKRVTWSFNGKKSCKLRQGSTRVCLRKETNNTKKRLK